MGKNRKDRLPVALDHEFKKVVENGGIVEILCRTSLGDNGKGAWVFFVTDPEDGGELQLITHGKSKTKVYTSIVGITSFIRDLGFKDVQIPIIEDRSVVLPKVGEED